MQILNRMISKCREIFNDYIPDVWIYSDYYKGSKIGENPGYAISLYTESTTDSSISSDDISKPDEKKEANLPENIAEKCCLKLLDEILYVAVLFLQ